MILKLWKDEKKLSLENTELTGKMLDTVCFLRFLNLYIQIQNQNLILNRI